MEYMSEKYASSYIQKGTASTTVLACTHPSADRCERNKYTLFINSRWATREETLLGIARSVAVFGTHIRMGGRDRGSTVVAEVEIDTEETGTNRIGGQKKTIVCGEETGAVTEAMRIYPTSHTPKTDIGADKTTTTTKLDRREG